MNLFNLFSDIEKNDADADGRFNFTRRKMLKTTSMAVAGTTAFTALAMNKAFAADSSVTEVLNFALTLEYLEAEFYAKALASNLKDDSNFMSYYGLFEEIGKHEREHVDFLKTALGSAAVSKPEFDFTAKGMFPNPFAKENYPVYLTLSQAFEDTGVRAYKGQAANLMSNPDVLQAALQIHSVEARHAGTIRLLRGVTPFANEGNNDSSNGGAPAAVYKGENNIYQVDGVDLISLTKPKLLEQGGNPEMMAEKYVRESFDEPLTKADVLAIVAPFLK